MFRTSSGEGYRYYMVAIGDEIEANAAMIDFLDGDSPGLECRSLPATVLEFVGLAKGDIRDWVVG